MAKHINTQTNPHGLHVAIIMDGNGRWAKAHKKPRFFGHRAGAETLRTIVENAPKLGITTLTAYAFSADNWKRPQSEVSALMRLFQSYLKSEVKNLKKNGVSLSFLGRRDRFSEAILKGMAEAEKATANGKTLHLRLAVDYSARDMILKAAREYQLNAEVSRQDFNQLLSNAQNGGKFNPDVDLLIRTGGEKRLSDFLLWECAYAELFFSDVMWPDFNPAEIRKALDEFDLRERRFGGLPGKN